jgi:hypothetical protein
MSSLPLNIAEWFIAYHIWFLQIGSGSRSKSGSGSGSGSYSGINGAGGSKSRKKSERQSIKGIESSLRSRSGSRSDSRKGPVAGPGIECGRTGSGSRRAEHSDETRLGLLLGACKHHVDHRTPCQQFDNIAISWLGDISYVRKGSAPFGKICAVTRGSKKQILAVQGSMSLG